LFNVSIQQNCEQIENSYFRPLLVYQRKLKRNAAEHSAKRRTILFASSVILGFCQPLLFELG